MAKRMYRVRDLMIGLKVSGRGKKRTVVADGGGCGGTSVCCTVCSIDRELQLGSKDAVVLYKKLEKHLQASLSAVKNRKKELARR